MRDDFGDKFASFLTGCQRITEAHRVAHFPETPRAVFEAEQGKVRIRVVRDRSAHCFVCIESGDVLKPAGWKAPAKHARGNIFDEHNGLGSMGPYGPAYLR